MIQVKELQYLAALSPNKEICGAILESGEIVPIRNVSPLQDVFVFNKSDWFGLINSHVNIKCLYHSHLNCPPEPSQPDLESQQRHKFDLLIVTLDDWRYVPYES